MFMYLTDNMLFEGFLFVCAVDSRRAVPNIMNKAEKRLARNDTIR